MVPQVFCETVLKLMTLRSQIRLSRVGQGSHQCGAAARHVFGAAALASCAGQLVVLGCGTLWIGLKFRTGTRAALKAGCLPFLPGLAAKSLLCGAAAALIGTSSAN